MKYKSLIIIIILIIVILFGIYFWLNNKDTQIPTNNQNQATTNDFNLLEKIEESKVKEHLILNDIGDYIYDREYSINAKEEISGNTRAEKFSHEEYWAYYNCESNEGCAEVIVRKYPTSFDAKAYLDEKTEIGWSKQTINGIEVHKFNSDTSKQFIWKKGSMVVNVNGISLKQFNKDIDGRENIELLFNTYFEKYN